MDLTRKLIIERVKRRSDLGVPWVLDVYCYLVQRGTSPDRAAKAMSDFVDDLIATKARRLERAE